MQEKLKNHNNNPEVVKEILQDILSDSNEVSRVEKIKEIIPTIFSMSFFFKPQTNSQLVLQFLDDYYNKYSTVEPLMTESFPVLFSTSYKDAGYIKELDQKYILSPWFFDLIKPNAKNNYSVTTLQMRLHDIEYSLGVSLQESANKYYQNFRNTLRPQAETIINKYNQLESHLTEPIKNHFFLFKKFLLSGKNYYGLVDYLLSMLNSEQKEELMKLVNSSVQDLLFVKMYIEAIIGEVFETMPNVIYFDMQELVVFDSKLPESEKVLSPEIVVNNLNISQLYNQIINMGTLNSILEIDELAANLKKINIKERFYDDMLKARRKSAKLISAKLYKPSDDDLYKDQEESKKYTGAKIYDLRDQNKKFGLIVRSLSEPFDENNTTAIKNYYDCYSYINDSMPMAWVSSADNIRYVYGYTNIEEDSLVFASPTDGYRSARGKGTLPGDVSVLADGERNLVEVNIINKVSQDGYIPRKPEFIIAYGKVIPKIYEESIRLNIPIILLNPVVKNKNEPFYDFSHYSYTYYETSMVEPEELTERLKK